MSDDQHRFLMLLGELPARLAAGQVAWVLNCQTADIPILVAARLFTPLGSLLTNSVKYFATLEVTCRTARWECLQGSIGDHRIHGVALVEVQRCELRTTPPRRIASQRMLP
jgi:hypothetical protein